MNSEYKNINKSIAEQIAEQELIEQLWKKVQDKMFFTYFGNTEYAGYFIGYDKTGWFTFRTSDGVGMTKKVSTKKIKEMIDNNEDYF